MNSMAEVQYSYDENGSPRADFPSEFTVVGWFLEQDLGSSEVAISEMIQVVDDVAL